MTLLSVRQALAPLFLIGFLTACGGGGDSSPDPTPPAPTPAATLSLGATSGTVQAGNAATVAVSVSRSGGFAGAVTIAATGAPAGVTVTGGTIEASATSGTLNIVTTAEAAAGTTNLSITGTGTGVTIAPVGYALTVTAPPGVTLALGTSATSVAAGGSTTAVANITRTNGFTGPVAIEAAGVPAGVTVSGGTIDASGTSLALDIAAASSAVPGTTEVTITGTADGVTITPVALSLTVLAPLVGQIGDFIGGEAGGDQAAKVALSADGSRVVIGAPYNDGTASNAGHARVYERTGDTWTQLGADLEGEVAGDLFGTAVAINDAGTRVVVGSYFNIGEGPAGGHARVYEYTDGGWVQLGSDIDGSGYHGMGYSVAMSASGHRVVLGGPGVGSENGAVGVYEWSGSAWVPVGTQLNGYYSTGYAVAISDDGNRFAYSLPSGSSDGPGTVVVLDWNGTNWEQAGQPINGEAADDDAGHGISLSGDGSMIAIGAPLNDGAAIDAGQVRVYRFEDGAWTQVGADLEGVRGSAFGQTVSLSAAGNRLLAGGPSPSTIRLYTLVDGQWVLATEPVFTIDRRAGSSVSLSADGLVGAVGAEYGDTAAGNAAGIVRVYTLPAF